MKPHTKSCQQDGAATDQRWGYDGALWIPAGVYAYNESEAEQSTTSSTFGAAVTLSTGTIPAGDYYVFWSAATRHSSTTGSGVHARVQVDGADLFGVEHFYAMKDASTNQRMMIAGVLRTTFGSEASHTIDLDYHVASGTGFMYNSRLMIRDANDTAVAGSPGAAHRPRLKSINQSGAAGDQKVRWNGTIWTPMGHAGESESLSRSTTTSSTFQQKLRHTTPSLVAGKYLITWHILTDRTSTTGDIGVQVDLDDTDVLQGWELELPFTSANQTTMFSGFVERDLTAAVHTIDVDWREVTGGSTSAIKEVWVTIEQVGF